MRISFTACSHPGKVRTNNEDNLYCDGQDVLVPTTAHGGTRLSSADGLTLTPETRDVPFSRNGESGVPCLFAVCDGMGGEADGEFASLTAVTTLGEHAQVIKSAAFFDNTDKAMQDFVTDANDRLCRAMRSRSARMGTTLALAVITEDTVRTYNIGDSRIYRLQDGAFSRLSVDHTLAAQKVRMGLLTEEEAQKDRSRHVLTRYLGVFGEEMIIEADVIAPFAVNTGCRLLLCSDGLTDMVSECEIETVLRGAPDTGTAADTLIAKALQNGGKDNVTCIVIDCGGEGL